MPIITLDVENVEETVTRNVVLGVVEHLISAMGITYNTKLLYPGSNSPEDLPIGDTLVVSNVPHAPEMNVLISSTEEHISESASTMVMDLNENTPLFEDAALGIKMSPIYSTTELKITISYHFPDKGAATKQLSDIRRHSSLFRDGLMHELSYYYLLPKVNVVILKNLFDLRETQAPYNQTMTEWFAEHMNDQVTVYTNRIGERGALGKAELQAGIVGDYDFEVMPDNSEKNDENSAHTLTFDYTVRYDKILSVMMKYPHHIHNLPIPTTMYDRSMPYELGLRLQLPSRTRMLLDDYSRNNYVTAFHDGAPAPSFNEWHPTSTPHFTTGLVRIMTLVDPVDLRALINLTELGEISLAPFLIEYMKQEHNNISAYKACAISVMLYENDKILSNVLEIDADLNVRTNFDLDLRKSYQIYVSLVNIPDVLEPVALERLRYQGALCVELFKGIDNTLESRDLLPTVMSNDYISLKSFNESVKAIHETKQPTIGTATYGNFTVGNFVIKV